MRIRTWPRFTTEPRSTLMRFDKALDLRINRDVLVRTQFAWKLELPIDVLRYHVRNRDVSASESRLSEVACDAFVCRRF